LQWEAGDRFALALVSLYLDELGLSDRGKFRKCDLALSARSAISDRAESFKDARDPSVGSLHMVANMPRDIV